jgi:anti-sigma B factor antagonist
MSENNLQINVKTNESYTLVVPSGDIDLSKSSDLRTVFQQIFQVSPAKIVVDLHAVSYMDSSGVATLIEALQLSNRAENKFAICCLTDGVKSIIELARLDKIFPIYLTREDAIES